MADGTRDVSNHAAASGDVIEIDLNFESMRRFQAEFSSNLSTDGLFIDTGEPLESGSVIRFRVILPEDFVFLEGTAVVEWQRPAEAGADGPPGMALRFVALSPQNQELVEQLVRDYVAAGGAPFNLDVRPVPTDFPTDALEGASPAPVGQATEGYRLTIRRRGPGVDAEALRALAEALPSTDVGGAGDLESMAAVGDAALRTGFERDDEDAGAGAEAIGDPPELDWSDDLDGEVGTERDGSGWPGSSVRARPGFLPVPPDFDNGPEVIADVDRDGFGPEGESFRVDLPNHDDGPDRTPVLPDGDRDDAVIMPPDEQGEESSRPHRLWPWALGLVFVVAVAGGLVWPRLADWFGGRGRSPEPAAVVASESARAEAPPRPAAVVAGDRVGVEPGETPATADGGDGDGERSVRAGAVPAPGPGESEATDPMVGAAVEIPDVSAPILARADAVTAVELSGSPRGTTVRIRGNGSVEAGVVSLDTLASPPRVLVRLRGIETGYRPYTVESNTSEVLRARIGHHADRRPPELWVVLDLADDGAVVEGLEVDRDLVQFVVAHP